MGADARGLCISLGQFVLLYMLCKAVQCAGGVIAASLSCVTIVFGDIAMLPRGAAGRLEIALYLPLLCRVRFVVMARQNLASEITRIRIRFSNRRMRECFIVIYKKTNK